MAKSVEAYLDNRGNLHLSPSSAIIADLAMALGRVGDEGGMTEGVARLILEKRAEIEQAFADIDSLHHHKPIEIAPESLSNIEVLDLERKRIGES
ncbi:hypothetical protein [Tsuneonella mangrovi]|uniref:hypothetical protein n=1 Tax=Tsuneonella mangrovi TaxID=1982042 RepID=UPI001F0A3AA9|nr:hypothetical protein [Tsuneonella mangrovi]